MGRPASAGHSKATQASRSNNLLLLNLGKWVLGLLSWAISSVGRAPALQAGGHGFESRIVHHESCEKGGHSDGYC